MGKYRFHRQRYGEILIGRLKRMHQAGKTEFVNMVGLEMLYL